MKRNIFRFNGENPTAINLEHVSNMSIEGRRITFGFYSHAIYIDMENEESAKNIFEQLLKEWAGDVTEKN